MFAAHWFAAHWHGRAEASLKTCFDGRQLTPPDCPVGVPLAGATDAARTCVAAVASHGDHFPDIGNMVKKPASHDTNSVASLGVDPFRARLYKHSEGLW